MIGLKEASFNPLTYEQTVRRIRALPKKISLLTGNDTFLYLSLLLGADGMLIVYANLVTELHIKMYEAVKRGDLKDGKEIDDLLLQLTNLLFSPPGRNMVARIKEALHLLGIIKNPIVYPPNQQIDEEEKLQLKKILRDLNQL